MLNADARGGLAAIKAVRAVDMRVVEHQGDVDVLVHYRANRDGCMRVDVDIGGNVVFTEALTRSQPCGCARNWP